ncbi:acetamidase/formamidase family protein [Sphingomonas nostoxanthinifaciens]|nr:acetamidase/formamidase family protein [Sphingomonas nostoxanthinifaciens]
MDFWNFSTAAYVEQDREEGWRRALDSVGLGLIEIAPGPNFFGIAAAITTPHQSEYLYFSSRSQQIRIPRVSRTEALLLLIIEGRGSIMLGQGPPVPVMSGDFVFGAPRTESIAAFDDDVRLLQIKLPRSVLMPRLLAPMPDSLQLLSGDFSFAAIFADLLASLSSKLGTLTGEQFRAIDTTIIEFLATSILSDGDVAMMGGIAARRAGVLHRVAQTIERRLAEPELGLAEIAAENGMSVRNLQKLFEAFDKTFSTYVRSRRLERCRDDLASPLLAQLSISEICYRWGFTDPAYFSRTFREEFGVSPREFRRMPHLHQPEDREGRTFRRGRPDGAEPATEGGFEPLDRGALAILSTPIQSGQQEHHIPASSQTIHWGYFSRNLRPVVEVNSGDFVTIECLTHHAYDDHERMIAGDRGAEDVFRWTAEEKTVDRRGAGPMDASTCGRGAGEGFGVHILTGPIAIAGAKPGDVLEVRILSTEPRPSRNPIHEGSTFGSNAAASWGFHHKHMLTEPREREVITIYEVDNNVRGHFARALYSYRWTPQTDPFGVVHDRMDYPGVPVDPATIQKKFDILKGIEIPVRPHFGVIAVAPDHAGLVDSVPPSSFGGNIDNWRAGAGAKVFLPVAVPGALLSIGDPHASQGDGEACGTAIECSLTGRFQLILHKRANLAGQAFADLTYPLIETDDEWVISGFSHPNYLEELGQNAQSEIYKKSSIDFAMRDAFRKVRRFFMGYYGLSEDEAISLISVAVDFGITQVADGNWGVHAIVRKAMFGAIYDPIVG